MNHPAVYREHEHLKTLTPLAPTISIFSLECHVMEIRWLHSPVCAASPALSLTFSHTSVTDCLLPLACWLQYEEQWNGKHTGFTPKCDTLRDSISILLYILWHAVKEETWHIKAEIHWSVSLSKTKHLAKHTYQFNREVNCWSFKNSVSCYYVWSQ